MAEKVPALDWSLQGGSHSRVLGVHNSCLEEGKIALKGISLKR